MALAGARVAVTSLAVAYARVSSEEQAQFGGSLAMQADRLATYCKFQGLELVETFVERGVSGSVPLGERRRGKAMMDLIGRGDVNHVVALKLDRLFRDAGNALSTTHAWDKAGVTMHLVDMGGQSLNTSSAMGRLMLTVLAGLAEMERNLISERTTAVLWHKRRKGEVYSPTPLGFRREGKRLVSDDAEQATLTRIRAMAAAGTSLNKIAATLNAEGVPTKRGAKWYASTVTYLLKNQNLYGKRAA